MVKSMMQEVAICETGLIPFEEAKKILVLDGHRKI